MNLTMLTWLRDTAWLSLLAPPGPVTCRHYLESISGCCHQHPVNCQAQAGAARIRVKKPVNTQMSLYFHKLAWLGKFICCSRLKAVTLSTQILYRHWAFKPVSFVELRSRSRSRSGPGQVQVRKVRNWPEPYNIFSFHHHPPTHHTNFFLGF